jgi:hypothetical protein
MAKRKTYPGGGKRKAPGERKPKKKAIQEIGEHCLYPPLEEQSHEDGGLTWKQEKFVAAYIDCDGNATEAYFRVYGGLRKSAGELGNRMMKRQEVIDAIEAIREDFRRMAKITREKMLITQIAMYEATLDDFTDVLNRPGNKDSYRGLGRKKKAIKCVSQGEFGNSITLIDPQVALDALWKKLGYEKGSDPTGERDVTGSVHERVLEVLGRKKDGASR